MDRKVVIIPTYNEKENIEAIIRKVFSLDGEYNVLIIDDGSPDGTATIVKRLQEEFPDKLFMIERSGKLGLGTAYLTGFKWALEHGYDYIFEMDADFPTTPRICRDSTRPAPDAEAWPSAPATATESVWSTGRSAGS